MQSSTHLLVPPGKPLHQTIHYPTANFRPLSRGSVPNPMLITAFDTYFIPRSLGACQQALGLKQDTSNYECSALTHFSKGLTPK